ncbi:hypothetical protein PGT21_020517 [Puccinia graminis f. sp. tritici]|uniref:Uncharacterized protein n=1 Tax=Puccinia graminis f. sp. tritici TaxID=56615 RepID=A0A5B0PAX4_PUCGR|nr:hypothetical protein PGT21_020517 [Puccinia graminis f. sp. tritici]
MYLSEKNYDKTNALLKEALTSQTGNGELRALYTYFLIESNQIKQARDFTVATLKDHDKSDVYALCASVCICGSSLAIALAEHVISPSNVNAPSSNGAFAPDASNVRAQKSSRLYHYPD